MTPTSHESTTAKMTASHGRASVTRVCHITTVHPVDDHRIVYKECVSLREAGYDVTLIAPHPRDTSVAGVPVTALQVSARTRIERIVRHPQAAYRAALALDADLYHFHDPEFLPYGTRLARAGKRVVYDAHEDVPTQIRSKDWLRGPSRAPLAHAIARLEAAGGVEQARFVAWLEPRSFERRQALAKRAGRRFGAAGEIAIEHTGHG